MGAAACAAPAVPASSGPQQALPECIAPSIDARTHLASPSMNAR